MRNPTPIKTIRELDWRGMTYRRTAAVEDSVTDEIVVAVHDTRSDESFEIQVAAADALVAFHHPYVYANRPPTGHSITV